MPQATQFKVLALVVGGASNVYRTALADSAVVASLTNYEKIATAFRMCGRPAEKWYERAYADLDKAYGSFGTLVKRAKRTEKIVADDVFRITIDPRTQHISLGF